MAKSRSVGTKLKIAAGSNGSTMTEVGSLKSISGIDASMDTVDVTDLGNTDGYREFVGGFKDGGEVGVSGYFDGENSGQVAIMDAFEAAVVKNFEIDFPAGIGKKWTFSGLVTKISTAASVDDAVSFEASIKVSGKPTLAALAG